MTYHDIIQKYRTELIQKANLIKEAIDTEYEVIEDSTDILNDFLNFREKFDIEVNNFYNTYSISCPHIIVNSPYRLYSIKDSFDISINLREYYSEVIRKILDKLAPIDDSIEIEEL